jgi:hypothetical protein
MNGVARCRGAPAPGSRAASRIRGARRLFPAASKAAAPSPTRDPQPRETEQQRGPQQVGPVADQQNGTPAARAQQPRGLACMFDGVARSGLDQRRRLRHTAIERDPAHDLGFGHRSPVATRQQQQRRGTRPQQVDDKLRYGNHSSRLKLLQP